MTVKILILGAAGMLGTALQKELGQGHEVIARDLCDYDIGDREAFVRDLAATKAAAVVNAAAYTQVDQAEDEVELATQANGEAPGVLAAGCKEAGARLVHVSTDYVFDGRSERPYREDDPTGPINVYGRSKLLGEQRVLAAYPEGSLILRTSWLFGPGGKNFVRTMVDKYQAGERDFRVVSDQHGRPTYTEDLARAIKVSLEQGLTGLYHFANAGATTWWELARTALAAAGAGDEVTVARVATGEFKTKAIRPRYSVLDTSRFEADSGFALPGFVDAVERYVAPMGGDDG